VQSAPARRAVGPLHRILILALVAAILIAAIVGSATVKRRRAANQTGTQAAVAFVHPTGRAHSTAWYCPGPLPLGLKHDSAHLMIANAATRQVTGQMLVATTIQKSYASSITVGSESTIDVPLPNPKHSAFAAVSLLTNGSGIGVEEVVDEPTGRVATPCVARATASQYIPIGSTKGGNSVTLSLYDPGATPSVANVSFATANGTVNPQPLQGLPIAAGQLVVVNVAANVAQTDIVSTMVNSTGGSIVAGAEVTSAVGAISYPSLTTGAGLAQSQWFLPALPAGGSTFNYIYVMNPSSTATTATVSLSDGSEADGGDEVATLHVPAGGVARLTQGPARTLDALRWSSVTAKPSPVFVAESSLIESAIVMPPTSKAKAHAQPGAVAGGTPASPVEGLPATVPVGYAATSASVQSSGWMITGGALSSSLGEFITVANPTEATAVVSLATLSAGLADTVPECGALLLGPGESLAVDLGKVLPNSSSLTVLVHASAGVIAAAGFYAKGSKGSKGSIGLSEPVAIPLD
jgi:hypothetical protein